MKVTCHYRTDPDRSLTDPLPEKKNSFVFRLYSGDFLDPSPFHWIKKEHWFEPPYPSTVYRYSLSLWQVLLFLIITTAVLVFSLYLPFAHGVWWVLSWPVTLLLWLLSPGKFVAWRFDKRGGYAGSKLFGVDSPAYKEWPTGIKPEDVYDGSQAMCLTIRPFASLND